MRLAIFGDIHGNILALEAALAGVKREGADALCITGDYVGYYYWPMECLELLKSHKAFMIKGNHEHMHIRAVIDPLFRSDCIKKYGSSYDATLGQISPETIALFKSLPDSLQFRFGDQDILVAHGSIRKCDEYVYPDSGPEVLRELLVADSSMVILGHTHYQMQISLLDSRDPNRTVHVINPGSVGQPRDRRPGAAWALFDCTGSIKFFTEPYNIASVVSEVLRRDPSYPYLGSVLTRK